MGLSVLDFDTHEVRVLSDAAPASLRLFVLGNPREWNIELPPVQGAKLPVTRVRARDVLWTEVKNGVLELSYLLRRPNGNSSLVRSHWKTDEMEETESEENWCSAVMAVAYDGITAQRRLRVLVNPYGGKGNAPSIFEKTVQPIFEAARCSLDTTFTERPKHALDIAKELSLDYDAIVVLSGDGLIHEVINGFAQHEQPLKAFAVPIAPIPTGSANAMALNLLGREEGLDPAIAALNAIKGMRLKHDLCSLVMGNERHYTFLSQALGVMADVDLGTEHLRWMGEMRFSLGYIYGVLKLKAYPFTVQINVVDSDKDNMYEEYCSHQGKRDESDQNEDVKTDIDSDGLPVLRCTDNSISAEDGWITFDKPILWLYAGNVPFVARDLMQFPLAQAGSGLLDVVVQEPSSRYGLFRDISGAARGKQFWRKAQHYYKARAYRVIPHALESELNFAVDGERYPCRAFTVECHKHLGTFLASAPHFCAEFNVPRPNPAKLRHRPRWWRVKRYGDEDEGEDEGESESEGLRDQIEEQHAEDEDEEDTGKRKCRWKLCPCF